MFLEHGTLAARLTPLPANRNGTISWTGVDQWPKIKIPAWWFPAMRLVGLVEVAPQAAEAQGWPFRCFAWQVVSERTGAGGSNLLVTAWSFPSGEGNDPRVIMQRRRIALCPLPIGLFANAVCYGVAAFVLCRCVSVTKQRLRLAKGQCGSCGYPLEVESRCPECGAHRSKEDRQAQAKGAESA